MTYSPYTPELIEALMAITFADAGIWDLNDVYTWQITSWPQVYNT